MCRPPLDGLEDDDDQWTEWVRRRASLFELQQYIKEPGTPCGELN